MNNKYPYGLTESDFYNYNNGRLCIHRISNTYDIGTIHESQHFGLFKIEEIDHIGKYSMIYYKIMFISTGSTIIAPRSSVRSGRIKDPYYYKLYIGKIYSNNSGKKFKVIEYTGMVRNDIPTFNVKFLDSGEIVNKDIYAISIGKVQDPSYHVHDKIFPHGDQKIITDLRHKDNALYRALQHRWNSMLSRCYDPENNSYRNYGELGITVCERWKCFSNYILDVVRIEGFDRDKVISSELELDKDLKQIDLDSYSKIYSPETCVWLSVKENNFNNMNKLKSK